MSPDERRDLDAIEAAKRVRGRAGSIRGLGAKRAADRPTHKPRDVSTEELDAIYAEARCAGSPEDWSAPRYQSEARHLRTTCMVCPVRQACLDMARRTWATGMHGGIVLVAGYIAAEGPATIEEKTA